MLNIAWRCLRESSLLNFSNFRLNYRSFHNTSTLFVIGGGRAHKDKPLKAETAAVPKKERNEVELAQLEAARKEREIKKKEIKAKQILIQKKREEAALKKKESSGLKKKNVKTDLDEID